MLFSCLRFGWELVIPEDQNVEDMVRLTNNIPHIGVEWKMLTYNGNGSMEDYCKAAKAMAPCTLMRLREDKIHTSRPYRLNELEAKKEGVYWYKREEVAKYVPSVRFGLRSYTTRREWREHEMQNQYRLPVVILAAQAVMIR